MLLSDDWVEGFRSAITAAGRMPSPNDPPLGAQDARPPALRKTAKDQVDCSYTTADLVDMIRQMEPGDRAELMRQIGAGAQDQEDDEDGRENGNGEEHGENGQEMRQTAARIMQLA